MPQARPVSASSHPDFDHHEQVVAVADPGSGLNALVAIHSTVLGPAFGGCRMWPYRDQAAALTDALRLSRAMTFKAAICGLPYGGGKAVVIGDPRREKSPALLQSLGQVVEELGGRYIIADDVGISLDDLQALRMVTSHTAAATVGAQQPLAATAYGVVAAMRAAVRHHLGQDRLRGARVAIQGLGQVGFALARYLHQEQADLVVTDVDVDRVRAAERAFGAFSLPPDQILSSPADILAPCALGGVLDAAAAARTQARIICGGANNQLRDDKTDDLLAARGIVFVPDYLASAGGVIDFHQERIDDRPAAVLEAVGRIGNITYNLLERAARSGRTPKAEADDEVRRRLAGGRPLPPRGSG